MVHELINFEIVSHSLGSDNRKKKTIAYSIMYFYNILKRLTRERMFAWQTFIDKNRFATF